MHRGSIASFLMWAPGRYEIEYVHYQEKSRHHADLLECHLLTLDCPGAGHVWFLRNEGHDSPSWRPYRVGEICHL
jgi:hypothetical protein